MKQTMKSILLVVGLCCWIPAAYAGDDHDHDHKHEHAAGPRGGKLLENSPPHAEFFVEKDRTVSFVFYNEELKPVAASEQQVTVIAEAKSGRVRIPFEKREGKLVSKKKLPEGDGYRVVVLLRGEPGAKSQNFRFEFHDEVCVECKRAEYACICEEGKHEHGKEGHKKGDGHEH